MESNSAAAKPLVEDALVARLVTARCASAQIVRRDASAAKAIDGVADVFLAEDFGGENASLPWRADEPLLAAERIDFAGQPIALVVAESEAACRKAEAALEIEVHSSPAVLSVEHAVAVGSYHGESHRIERGDCGKELSAALHRIEGKISIGSQAAFGREVLCAEAWPEGGAQVQLRGGANAGGSPGASGMTVAVAVAAEAPSRVRSAVAGALGLPESMVRVEALPLSGMVGGKELEAGEIAALTALAALRTGRRVRLALTREQDTAMAGKRAAVEADFHAGFDDEGHLLVADLNFAIDAGWTVGDSETTRDRVLLHADGAYHIAHFRAQCRLCRTHRVVSASLPAEGSAQAALVMEEVLSRIAHRLDLPIEEVRQRNLYRSDGDRVTTHYGQTIEADVLAEVWNRGVAVSKLAERRDQIEAGNATNPCFKRGIGVVPVKLGVGDTRSDRNQATAVVQVMIDGSVTVHLGVASAGTGITDRVRGQVSNLLGVPAERINAFCGDLDAVPYSTVGHAVDAGGLMAQAVAVACQDLKQRLRPVASQLLAASGGGEIEDDAISFSEGQLWAGPRSVPLAEVVESAWRRRVSLIAVGHHRTPKLWWDPEVGGGWPFEYYALGTAVAEVQLDAFTGEIQILRVDLALDLGGSHLSEIDIAQATRAFQMGAGWQLSESLRHDGDGTIMNASSESYLPPGFADAALDFRLHDVDPSARRGAAGHRFGTAVESPVVLAIAVREAVREAIRSFGAGKDVEVELSVPANPEAVLGALRDLSRRVAEANRKAAEAPVEKEADADEAASQGRSKSE